MSISHRGAFRQTGALRTTGVALGRVRAVALAKTGKLTKGSPEVTDIVVLDGAEPDDALAAAVEARRLGRRRAARR